jgi:UDP-glucose 4-epimerase
MKTVLVIGLGFIGHHVVNQLLKEGFSVTVLERNPSKDFFSKDYEIILGDVRDRNLISDVIRKFDGVINLAGILGTSETINNPFPSVDTNIIGALNVFEAIKSEQKDTKLVHITVGNHFMNNTYAITKSASERFALMYNREHGTKISVVRALNAYGPYQKHEPVRKMIPNFILTRCSKFFLCGFHHDPRMILQ